MTDDTGVNHRLAPRMCLIAAVTYNVTLACTFGTFSILVEAAELHLQVTREVSSLGLALVLLGIAGTSPFVGGLAAKISLRTLMVAGLTMQVAAYVILAVSRDILINLAAYGVLIGPGLCLTATVLPATLVTRWYRVNRGRALGLVFISLGLTIMPLLSSLSLAHLGLATTYLLIAVLLAVTVLPALFVVDWPPEATATAAPVNDRNAASMATASGTILRRRDFWALTLAYASITMISSTLTSFLIPMVKQWGIEGLRAASLLSIVSFAGMAGTVIFGTLADRIGPARALTVLCVDTAVLWALMLTAPPFALLAPLVALIGFHAAAASGVFAASLSDHFGESAFARAFGLGNVISLPFGVAAIPLSAWVFIRTGSYAIVLVGMIVFVSLAAAATAMTERCHPSET